jgi:inner membrane protein
MMFITHAAFAIFLGLLAVKMLVIPVQPLVFVAIIVLGSLMPDIDSGTSFIGRKFKLGGLFFRHRGMVHSIVFMMGFSIAAFLITKNIYYFLAFAVGYFSHLVLDSRTMGGVVFFWPSKIRTRGSIRTMGLADIILFIVLVALDLLIIL